MGKLYIFIIVLLLTAAGGGYYVYNKQKQELLKLKLESINSKILGIDTIGILKLDTLNPAIKLTIEDIQRQRIYLDTLSSKIKRTKSGEIDIDSALQILKNL